MNLLRNRLIGPYLRQFSTNSPAIRSQILENLASTSQFLATVPKVRQPPRKAQRQVAEAIEELKVDPLPVGSKKLKGTRKRAPDTFRIRTGEYRILYQIEDEKLVVLVVKLDGRSEIYRGY